MKYIIKIWITLTAFTLLFSACKKESIDSNSIIGKWELTSHNIISNGHLAYNLDYQKGKSYIYHFNLDNTYTLNDVDSILEHGSYKLDSSKFSFHCVIRPGYEKSGTFNSIISNTTLTFFNNGHDTNGEYTETFIYTRKSHF
jgi:hypothetical protein